MGRIVDFFRRARRRSIVKDQGGVAAVEFALISTGMFAMLSGAVDMMNAITIHRDLNRVAAEIVMVLAACSNESCVDRTILSIMDRRGSVAPQFPTMELGMVRFCEKSNQIEGNSVGGNMTYLPADMNTEALTVLTEGDCGVGVRVAFTHRPIILGFANDWGFTTKNFSAVLVTVRSRA